MCTHVEKKTEQNINMPILCGKKCCDVNVKRYRWKSSIEILQISSQNLSDGPPTRSIKRVYCLFEICYSEGLSLAVGDVYDI